MSYLSDMVDAYTECALWSSTDFTDDGETVNLQDYELADETVAKFRKDCEAFLDFEDAQSLEFGGWNAAQAGHDFWLTRNSHGAGFWDRGRGEHGDILTALAKTFGTCDLYVGDDGKVYAS